MTEAESHILTNQVAIASAMCALLDHTLGYKRSLACERLIEMIEMTRLVLDRPLSDLATAIPDFECEDCIGMRDHGCYCKAMGATAPGGPALTVQNGGTNGPA